jgi:tetratricopeptide (TPR) repeat protein
LNVIGKPSFGCASLQNQPIIPLLSHPLLARQKPLPGLQFTYDMTLQEQYDAAMFDFSRGDFTAAVDQFKHVLVQDPAYFDAQLALGMAYYRLGDFAAAIAEGHKAEKLRPKEQLVHTNLSLFYMKSGDKVTAEHHGLQARIAGWRAENAAAPSSQPDAKPDDPELQMARPKPPPVKVIRMPDKFPDQPWKKKVGG